MCQLCGHLHARAAKSLLAIEEFLALSVLVAPILLTEFVVLPRDVLAQAHGSVQVLVDSGAVSDTLGETVLAFLSLTFVLESGDFVRNVGGGLTRSCD